MTVAAPETSRVLLLPGWLNSDAGHWQSRWEQIHGYQRVEQNDWVWPKRGDWMTRLDEILLESTTPAMLVAHSLGSQLVAAWAAHSQHTERVRAALLVAPADTERADMPPNLFSWKLIERRRLPLPGHVVASDDDPYCAMPRAAAMATDWGCTLTAIGPRGHINADSGLGDWPEGHRLLRRLAGTPV
jgi:uncharacterized protein